MCEDMTYQQAIMVLSDLIHRRGTPEECRAYLTVMEELGRLRNEAARPRGMQIGDPARRPTTSR